MDSEKQQAFDREVSRARLKFERLVNHIAASRDPEGRRGLLELKNIIDSALANCPAPDRVTPRKRG
jgi:hypothetical protein